jgi:predicted ATP-dependent endonuclease of OLD family
VLIILYFAIASEHDVVLIEEPENHLHPDIQRRLFSFVRDCANRQFFLSTHSSVFLNTQLADRVFLCRFDESVSVHNATNRAAVLSELGYSIADNLVSDVIVLCEGPTDKVVIEEFFLKAGVQDKMNVKIWPLGGDIMDQLDLSVFRESYKVIALIDNDPGSSSVRKRFLEGCSKLGIECHRLQRYALENYLSLRAIKEVMGEPPNKIEELDFDKPIAEQLGYQVKRNGGRIAKVMSLEEISDTDLSEFIGKVSEL